MIDLVEYINNLPDIIEKKQGIIDIESKNKEKFKIFYTSREEEDENYLSLRYNLQNDEEEIKGTIENDNHSDIRRKDSNSFENMDRNSSKNSYKSSAPYRHKFILKNDVDDDFYQRNKLMNKNIKGFYSEENANKILKACKVKFFPSYIFYFNNNYKSKRDFDEIDYIIKSTKKETKIKEDYLQQIQYQNNGIKLKAIKLEENDLFFIEVKNSFSTLNKYIDSKVFPKDSDFGIKLHNFNQLYDKLKTNIGPINNKYTIFIYNNIIYDDNNYDIFIKYVKKISKNNIGLWYMNPYSYLRMEILSNEQFKKEKKEYEKEESEKKKN